MRQQVPHHRVPRPPAAPEQVPELPRAGVHRVDVEEGGARPHHVLLHEPPRLLPGGPLAAQQTLALGPGCQNTREWGIRFTESSGLNHNLADWFRENKKFKVFLSNNYCFRGVSWPSSANTSSILTVYGSFCPT